MTDVESVTVVTVVTTAPDADVAESLGEALVTERLAACVHIVRGARSIYRWEGELRNETEVMMVIKTTAAAMDAVRSRIVELHPYDVPEVIAFDVADGSPAYLDWVRTEVRSAG